MTSLTIDQMIVHVLRREGGYVNHPNDRGGPTNYGITRRALSTWRGHQVAADDVRNLSQQEAIAIYKTRYFTRPKLHKLPADLQPQLFDMAVNHGPGRAVKLLQRVINQAGFGPLEEDGRMGPATAGAARRALDGMHNYLHNALVDERLGFYRRIVARNPSQGVFLKGWTRRAKEFRRHIRASEVA